MAKEGEKVPLNETLRAMERIQTPQDFFDFLEILEEDIKHHDEFRQLPFHTGVDRIATFLYKNEDMPQEPDWKLFAEILIRGMNHA